jgi:Domain of unknown function (DUF1772)
LAAWPFTIFAMVPTNAELHRRADLATEGMREDGKCGEVFDKEETFAVLRKWTFLSKIRASLAMAAAICVIAALVV